MSLPAQLAGDLTAAEVAFSRIFMDAFKAIQPVSDAFVTRIPMGNRTLKLPIHTRLAKMRKWEGERITRSGGVYTYSVDAEKYELTYGVPLEDFEDDQLGFHRAMIAQIGEQAALWRDDLVFAALLAGSTDLGYDGAAFFANAHSLNGNTIDNLFASTALNSDNYNAVRAAMMDYVGEDGRSLRVMPNLLVVPPALERTAKEIVEATQRPIVYGANTAAAPIDNVMRGTSRVMVCHDLSAAAGGSDTTWYLMDTTRSVKPFVFAERKAPAFSQLTEGSEHAFKEDEVLYGARARGVVGYGPFWLAAKCTA
jgi:phage major head subunit gpT-like protein